MNSTSSRKEIEFAQLRLEQGLINQQEYDDLY